MEKTVTIKIPNELWVDDFSANKTAPFTYSGPAKVWLVVQEDNTVHADYYEEEPVVQATQKTIEIDVASATQSELEAAIYAVMGSKEHTYTYTPELNHDGSTYQKINNPKLNDYYTLRYNPATGFELKSIVKDTTVSTEKIAKDRKAYVEKYSSAFEFSTEDTAKIEAYLTSINTYLEQLKTVYPWKYVEIDKNEVPKVPLSLVQLFNTLPAIS
jgi:hypothetical protein